MTDGDDLVCRSNAGRFEREMQRSGAARNRTRMLRHNKCGELLFEECDLGTLRDPAGANHATGCIGLAIVECRPHDGNSHAVTHWFRTPNCGHVLVAANDRWECSATDTNGEVAQGRLRV